MFIRFVVGVRVGNQPAQPQLLPPKPSLFPVRFLLQQKRFWMADHGTEHSSDFAIYLGKDLMLLCHDIAAVLCEIQGCVGFIAFAVTIGELRDEMRLIAPF